VKAMHPYAIDAPERKMIPLVIAAVAIMSAWLLNVGLEKLRIAMPWWVDAPSVMGFYGIIYILFDKYLWRLEWLHRLGLIRTPILAGSWVGTLTSSFEPDTSKNARLRIIQSWTKIEISLLTDTSQSHSLVASILSTTSNGMILSYQYQNDPIPNTPDTMQIHYGTAKLVLVENKLEGEYYSGRGRQNTGALSFVRSSKLEE